MVHAEKIQSTIIMGLVLGVLSILVGRIAGVGPVFVLTVAIALTLGCLTMQTVAVAVGRSTSNTDGAPLPVIRNLRRKKVARRQLLGVLGHTAFMAIVAAAVHAIAISLWLLPTVSRATGPVTISVAVAMTLVIGAMLYGRAMSLSATPVTWLCPNHACVSRHISERHAWRCAFCVGVNQNVSMLDTCTCGDCRESPSGYICPGCGTSILFEFTGDPSHLATAAGWTRPKLETGRQAQKRKLQEELQDVTEEEEVLRLERLRDKRRQRLREAAQPRDPKNVFRARSQRRMDVTNAYQEERRLIEATYTDPRTRLQALQDLDDDLEGELDRLRRRTDDDPEDES